MQFRPRRRVNAISVQCSADEFSVAITQGGVRRGRACPGLSNCVLSGLKKRNSSNSVCSERLNEIVRRQLTLCQMTDRINHDFIWPNGENQPMRCFSAPTKSSLSHFHWESLAFNCRRKAVGIHFKMFDLSLDGIEPLLCSAQRSRSTPCRGFIQFCLCLARENNVHHSCFAGRCRRLKSRKTSRAGRTRPAASSSMPCPIAATSSR